MAHAVARPSPPRPNPRSHSISLPQRPLQIPYPLPSFLSFPFLLLSIRVRLPIPHPSRKRHKSLIPLFPSPSSASVHSTEYAGRPSRVATFRPLPCFGALPSRICGQFEAAKRSTDREGTWHTAAPTVPSHFEKYPGKMIRPLLRPGLSLSISVRLFSSLRFAIPICSFPVPSLSFCYVDLPLLSRPSFTGADCSSSSFLCPRLRRDLLHPSPAIIAHSRTAPYVVAILFPSPKRDAH